MLIIAALSLATLFASWWALHSPAGLTAFALTSFVWGVAVYFALLLRWLGVDRVFNGASAEAFGVLLLLAASAAAAAATAAALTLALRGWARTNRKFSISRG